jgi:rubrerythrin
MGAVDVAEVFENTAEQETAHAFGHLELLYPSKELTVERMLELAVEGETYEYTEMYPKFRHLAMEEGNMAAVKEMDEQIEESREHAEMFKAVLEKAAKRFAALAKVEERHAGHYQAQLDKVKAQADAA